MVATSLALSNNDGIPQIVQSLAGKTRTQCVLGAFNVLEDIQQKQTSSPDSIFSCKYVYILFLLNIYAYVPDSSLVPFIMDLSYY